MKKNKYEIDMCNGTIMDKLISFSVPLILSGILQLLFNAVDIIVVGRFSGSQALAAVGSTTALINIFTNLFIGISLGANVLAARFYAAQKDQRNVGNGTYSNYACADKRCSNGCLSVSFLPEVRWNLWEHRMMLSVSPLYICGFILPGCHFLCCITMVRRSFVQSEIQSGHCCS